MNDSISGQTRNKLIADLKRRYFCRDLVEHIHLQFLPVEKETYDLTGFLIEEQIPISLKTLGVC